MNKLEECRYVDTEWTCTFCNEGTWVKKMHGKYVAYYECSLCGRAFSVLQMTKFTEVHASAAHTEDIANDYANGYLSWGWDRPDGLDDSITDPTERLMESKVMVCAGGKHDE